MEREDTLDPDNLNRPEWNGLVDNYQPHDIAEAYFRGRIAQSGLQAEPWGIDMRHDDGDGLIFDNKMDLRLWEPMNKTDVPDKWPVETEYTTPESWYQSMYDDLTVYSNRPPDEADMQYCKELNGWQLRGVCDVKSKRNPDWLGVLNLRHLVHYAAWAREYNVPTFLYFTMVDMDAEEVGEKNILVPIEPFDYLDEYLAHFDRDTGDHIDWSEITEDCEIVERSFRAPDGNAVVKIDESAYKDFTWFENKVLN